MLHSGDAWSIVLRLLFGGMRNVRISSSPPPAAPYLVQDDAVTLWCLETRTCVLRGEGHGSWVTGVVFDYWTSRPPCYRFTSVGEDARLCM